jgi:hypothetical protein
MWRADPVVQTGPAATPLTQLLAPTAVGTAHSLAAGLGQA